MCVRVVGGGGTKGECMVVGCTTTDVGAQDGGGGGGPKGMCVCVVGELKAIVWVCGSGGPQGCACRVIRGVEDPRGCVGEPQTVVWVVGEDHRSVCVVGGL